MNLIDNSRADAGEQIDKGADQGEDAAPFDTLENTDEEDAAGCCSRDEGKDGRNSYAGGGNLAGETGGD